MIVLKIKRGQILKNLRTAKGFNQKRLADLLNVSLTAYQKYEHGTAEPNFDKLSKIADFYGVSTDYLLGRTPVKQMVTEEPDPVNLLNLNPLEKSIVYAYIGLSPSKRTELVEIIQQIANGANVQLTINKSDIQPQPEPPTAQSMSQQPPQPVQRPIVQNPQQPVQPIMQSKPQQLQVPAQPQQSEVWRMAARSADGVYTNREMTQEEVDILKSLEDVPKSAY